MCNPSLRHVCGVREVAVYRHAGRAVVLWGEADHRSLVASKLFTQSRLPATVLLEGSVAARMLCHDDDQPSRTGLRQQAVFRNCETRCVTAPHYGQVMLGELQKRWPVLTGVNSGDPGAVKTFAESYLDNPSRLVHELHQWMSAVLLSYIRVVHGDAAALAWSSHLPVVVAFVFTLPFFRRQLETVPVDETAVSAWWEGLVFPLLDVGFYINIVLLLCDHRQTCIHTISAPDHIPITTALLRRFMHCGAASSFERPIAHSVGEIEHCLEMKTGKMTTCQKCAGL